jgi:hypothetical protein
MMEVVVSAAVLLLVVLGVMAGLDAVAGTAGANKARTVAATLAEKDQEELRSLMTVDLNRIRSVIPGPRTVNVDGVPYTITSDADLITDAGGEDISCSVDDGEGSFIRIKSTVTSPMTGAKVKPVVLTSIVAPEPGSGTLVAKVENAKGQPVTNMPVQAIGPETVTKTTNDSGCAVFGAVTAGAYQVKVNQTGWVNTEGDQEVIQTATVSAGTLSTVNFVYDVGARLTVNVNSIATVSDDSYGVIAAHTGILTGYRLFPEAAPTLLGSHQVQLLFPFEDAYKIYSGRCTGEDPTLFDEDYFTADNPAAAPELDPGQVAAITIYEPPVNVVVRFNAGLPLNSSSARVYAYPRTDGCSDPVRFDMGRTVTGGVANRPGLPFGRYDLCAQYTTGGYTYRANVTGVDNNAWAGTTPQAIDIPNTTAARQPCPAS